MLGSHRDQACIVVLAVHLLAIAPAMCGSRSEYPSSMSDERAFAVAGDFLRRIEPHFQEKALTLKESRWTCSGRETCVKEIDVGEYWMLIDPVSEEVVGFNARGSKIPAKTPDGRTVDQDLFQKEIVSIDSKEAESAARRFIESIYGIDALDSLTLSNSGTRPSGPGYYFAFQWTNTANEEGYREGNISLSVHINPTDGSVADASLVRNEIHGKPKLTRAEAVQIAEGELSAISVLGCVELKDVALIEKKFPELDGDELLWVMSYTGRCPATGGFIQDYRLFVDVRDSNAEALVR